MPVSQREMFVWKPNGGGVEAVVIRDRDEAAAYQVGVQSGRPLTPKEFEEFIDFLVDISPKVISPPTLVK